MLTNYAYSVYAEAEDACRMRECPFSSVPDPLAILHYYVVGAAALLLISFVANGALRLASRRPNQP